MSETAPHLSPAGAPNPITRLKRRAKTWLVIMIVSIAGIIIPPLIGLSGTVFGMVNAFDELGRNADANPEELAADLSTSMVTTAVGIIIAILFGFVFLASLIIWLVTLSNIKNHPEAPRT